MSHDDDILETNLEGLLRRAPEAERLGSDASARIARALRDAAPSPAAAEPEEPLRRISPVGAALAAAAVLLALVGARFAAGRLGAGPTVNDDPAVDVARVDTGDPTGPASGPDAGPNAERTPGVLPDAAETQAATVSPTAAADLPPLVGSVRLQPTVGTAENPTEVVLWTRPVLQLPRVADVRRHPLGAHASGEVQFSIAGERERARAQGATALFVQAEASGVGVARTVVPLDRAEPLALDVRSGRIVEGTVTDATTGTPIEGALVLSIDDLPLDALRADAGPSSTLPRPHATTDALGRFRLVGVTPGAAPELRASKPGHAPAWAIARAADDPDAPWRATLALPTGATFEGTVERPDGTRDSEAVVIASMSDESQDSAQQRSTLTFGQALTDAQGRYRIEGLAAGPHVLLVMDPTAPGGGTPSQIRFAQAVPGVSTRVDFLSAPSSARASVAGHLLALDGTPRPGVNLTIGGDDDAQDDWGATVTGPDGAFRFDDVEPGRYAILVARDDFRHMTTLWWGDVESATTVELRAADTRVTWNVSGSAEVWLMLEREALPGDWLFAGSAAGTGGPVVFEGLAPGRYRAFAAALDDPRKLGFGAPVDVRASSPVAGAIELAAGSPLELTVTDAAGGPAAGAVVEVVLPERGRPLPTRSPLRTDADGRLRIPTVPHGPVELRVTDGADSRVLPLPWFDGTTGAYGVTLERR